MVATRRGAQVSSPAKTAPEQSSDVLATPSTGRRTRTAVKQVECPTRHVVVETSSQLEKVETELPASPPTSPLKRCTRASRLHSPELPCTPVGSIHEADMSDLESCCSVLSDIDPPTTRTRGRRRPPCAVIPKDEDISEVESCSSAVSASKAALVSRRSTRMGSRAPKCYDPAGVGVEEVTDDHALESESCTSVVSESKRVTRSQRKTARTRSSAKQQIEDSEVSDADSYISGGSRAKVSHRATKSRRPTRSIPLHLDEATESSHSPAPRSRPTRAVRGKAPAIIDVSDPQSPDSDGLESGPTYSMTTRQLGKTKTTISIAMDSDPELTDRETPCSSRAGSGNSRVSTHSVKDVSIVVEKTRVSGEEESLVDDSRLESTLTTDDVDCTLLEEHESQTLEEKEVGNRGNLTSSEADTKKVERGEKEVVTEPVVMVTDQQEELSTENIDEDTSEVEMMQETIRPSMLLKPCRSVSVTCETASESNKEKGQTVEVADAHIQSSQGDKAVDEDAVVETRPNVEENMEVSTLSTDAQQVVESGEARVSSIQITMSQHKKITVDSSSLEQPQDAVVQNTKIISLLDSSDDEDDVSVVEEEEEEDLEYRAAGPSKASETAASSVEGLFMIDTRPGQDADELYYKERPTEEQEDTTKRGAEEEEQDEEFVDEEDDDDDDDNLLFSSRSLQLNNMSTRIDPGIRVKELGGLYINFGGKKSKPVSSSLQKLKETKIQDEVMKKSVIGPDFEKKDAVPPYSESKHALKLKRKAERGMTTGDGWFNMKAPEITQELKTDLNVLKMRGSLDPKRFYKKNDRDGFSKYFQVGTVVDSAVDFYHSRIPKKERKRTMVEELLADAEFRHKNKKKYQQIVLDKAAQGAGRKNKKKNKFHKK